MKLPAIALLLTLAASGAWAQATISTNGTDTVQRPISRPPTTLAASRQAMQQAETDYKAALAVAAPGLADLDAQIAQARQTLMDLQAQRQTLVRTAERSIADVANARDTARDSYLQVSRTQVSARQPTSAAQRVAP